MSETYRVIVVGAGPAGSAAAAACAQLGLGPVLLADRSAFPRYKPCGSAVSLGGLTALERVGLADEVRRRGAPIHTCRMGLGLGFWTRVDKAQGVVLNRSDLDWLLVQRAMELGVEFRPGVRAKGLELEGGRVAGVRFADGLVRAEWVIVATGASADLLPRDVPDARLVGAVCWRDGLELGPGEFEIAPPAAAEGTVYGWVFPEGEGRANLGVYVRAEDRSRPITETLQAFLAYQLDGRLQTSSPFGRVRGHPVQCNAGARYDAPPGVLVAGEAARLVNARTGEGIRHAIESGYAAADAIAWAGDDAARDPQAHHKAWLNERFGAELAEAVEHLRSRHPVAGEAGA
jgi:flavin-dependent dehydrogenase